MKKLLVPLILLSLLFSQPGFGQKLTFAFLTDLHVNPNSSSDFALQKIVEEINQGNYDFVVVTGDISNTGSNAEIDAVSKDLSRLNVPCYVIPGNHETNWSESAGLHFNRLFGNDRFLFRKNGFLMVGFNTGPFMKMGDGIVKLEDLQWLKRELKKAKAQKEILISFNHYPLAEGLSNWDKVTAILKENNCAVSFCGHGHRLLQLNFDGILGVMGRAMMMGKSPLAGYNIVEIHNDSVFVSQKVTGQSKEPAAFRFNYLHPDRIASLPVSKKPDNKVDSAYAGVKPGFNLQDTASVFSGPCVIDNRTIIYGNSIGVIKAVNIKSGKTIWANNVQGPVYSTPVAGKSVVAVGTVDGKITGFDLKKGNKLWEVTAGTPVLADGIAEGDLLYIGGGSSAFYKIEMTSGKVIWKFDGISGLIQGQPALSEKNVVFGAWDRHLYCLDKKTGELVWKWNNGKPHQLYSPGNIAPVIANGKVFIVAPDRCMTAIDLVSGKQIWRDCSHQVRESMGISPDKKQVYAKLMNDSVISVSTVGDQFHLNWVIDAGFGYEHIPCPIVSNDIQLIAGTREGIIISIDPREKRVNWKFKGGNSSINKIVLNGKGIVFATLSEGKIISLKK
jgi:outer membrane protein assembly factor BamB/predicted phosphodiesterase